MNDLSLKSNLASQPAHLTFGEVTTQLAKLSAASACCIDLFNEAPSLMAVAADSLRSFLPAGSRISNPDAIYVKSLKSDGSGISMSLTEALIQAMLYGADFMDAPTTSIYSRRDSTDEACRYTVEENRQIRSVVKQLATMLAASFEGHINAYWDRSQRKPGVSASSAPVKRIVVEQQAEALRCEAEIHCSTNIISAEEKDTLLHAFSDEVTQTGLVISIGAGGANTWQLPVVAVRHASASDDDAVFLVLPGKGLERLASANALSSAVVQRLTDRAADDELVRSLPVALRDQLERGMKLTEAAVHTSPLHTPVVLHNLEVVRTNQIRDFHYLCASARADRQSHAAFMSRIDSTRPSAVLSEGMGERVATLLMQGNSRFRPDWFRFGDENMRQEYERLEQDYDQRRSLVDGIFAGLESPADFALEEINKYTRANLGYSVDPRLVIVSVPDTIPLKSGTVKTFYKKSLFDFALAGLPAARGAGTVELPKGQANAAFDFKFVQALVTQVDAQRRYAKTLRARYSDESSLRALTRMRDSALALGVCAAVMQGHLRDSRSEELLYHIRSDSTKPGVRLRMGSLTLTTTGNRFKDVIVFEEQGADNHYVVYAPGAPAGRDFFEGSWHMIASEIGGWSATEAGVRYLLDQTSDHVGSDAKTFIEAIRLKPSLWRDGSVSFTALNGENFETDLGSLIAYKVERTLMQLDAGVPGLHTQTPHANVRTLAFIDARLDWLNQEFNAVTRNLMPYQDFVATEARRIFDEFLRESGINESFDPGTLYFDLQNRAYAGTPDFSQYTQLRSLTSLLAEGNRESLPRETPCYSSVGRALNRPVGFLKFVDRQLREADMGARYIKYLREEFLDQNHFMYTHRRAVMGMRSQFQMRRSAMFQFLNGGLSARQYEWLVGMIAALDEQLLKKDAALQQRTKGSATLPLRLFGDIVEGAYMFRDFSSADPQFNLLYTPDAPDGVPFRSLTNYADLFDSAEMRGYYYKRVSYRGQRMLATRYEEMARGINKELFRARIPQPSKSPGDVITDVYKLYDAMIGRMVADIDAQTTSTAEQWAEVLYTVVKWTGTILLLPFPVAGIAWGMANSGVSLFRGAIAYSYGDRASALPHLATAVLGVLIAGDGLRALSQGTLTVLKGAGIKTLTLIQLQGAGVRSVTF